MVKLSTFVLFSTFLIALKVNAQSLQRSVVASTGETLQAANISLTVVVGEPVSGLFLDNIAQKYLTVGFSQPDTELKQLVALYPEKPIVVYPNPTKTGIIKVAFNDLPETDYLLEVIDASGQVLQSSEVSYLKSSFLYVPLDISAYNRGVYFVRLKNGQTVAGQVKLIRN